MHFYGGQYSKPIIIKSLRTYEEIQGHVETNTIFKDLYSSLIWKKNCNAHTHTLRGGRQWHFRGRASLHGVVALQYWGRTFTVDNSMQCLELSCTMLSKSSVALIGHYLILPEGHAGVKHFNQKVSRREKCDLPKWCEISFNNCQLNLKAEF